MAKLYKQYFITALEMRDIHVSPDDPKFYSLMKRYETLLKESHTQDEPWIAAAKKLNDDFEKFAKKVFSQPPFEMDRLPCGIEVYSVEQIYQDAIGSKQLCLVGLEFCDVPFDRYSRYSPDYEDL